MSTPFATFLKHLSMMIKLEICFWYCINIFLFYNMDRDIFICVIFKKRNNSYHSAKAFFVSLNTEDENGEV